MNNSKGWVPLLASAAVVLSAAPGVSQACACGCGVFDVGTSLMLPNHSGGMVFLEQDFMDQNQNWSGTSRAPAANNEDKRIRTNFWTVGAQYMFNRSWGAMVEVPYWNRHFVTTDPDTGDQAAFHHAALGDIRIRGIYTGLSPNLSTGITFGLKVPSGDSTYANFDPDTQISTGSTDVMLGVYHLGALTADNQWSWFANAQWQEPIAHKDGYRPGTELNGVAGLYYAGWRFGSTTKLAPLVQINLSWRGHDSGLLSHPEDSGYTRAFVTPGLELDTGNARIYADVALPFYTNVSGNQLVATALYKLNLSFRF
jgi:hypothetical protein